MNREELITTSRESGLEYYGLGKDRERFIAHITRFAELVCADAFEQGRQEGLKQERALWELSKLGQEIEAQAEQEPVARVIDNGTLEGATEWIPFANRVEPLKTGDLLYSGPEERNFCPRCGKRTTDIHTCTPPQGNT